MDDAVDGGAGHRLFEFEDLLIHREAVAGTGMDGLDDAFLFGPETRGLPGALLDTFDSQNILRIPMQDNSRSLNLSNAASILVYEAWRQLGFV